MRQHDRGRTLKSGKIITMGGGVIDCVIRDRSETGARIRIGATSPLPKTFELQFTSDGAKRRAELRWQHGIDAGVVFIDAANAPAPE